jgi:hypothetical protein
MECLAATHCGDVAEICGAITVQTRTGDLIHNMVRRLLSVAIRSNLSVSFPD